MKSKTIISRLIRFFLQGLLFTGPIAITIYSIWLVFNWIDGILYKYIENLLAGQYLALD